MWGLEASDIKRLKGLEYENSYNRTYRTEVLNAYV